MYISPHLVPLYIFHVVPLYIFHVVNLMERVAFVANLLKGRPFHQLNSGVCYYARCNSECNLLLEFSLKCFFFFLLSSHSGSYVYGKTCMYPITAQFNMIPHIYVGSLSLLNFYFDIPYSIIWEKELFAL